MDKMTLTIVLSIVTLLVSIIQAAFWFWVNSIKEQNKLLNSSVTELTRSLNKTSMEFDRALAEYQLYVANNFVKQIQLDAHMDRIDKNLDEIKKMIERLHDRNNNTHIVTPLGRD
ncbi:hypothetical protein CA267_001800 [Alteromonas pelagimontana]|uniref:Uncharacterized protein n=1 Tax=Alteromonas pelagimontana TaxID=1858656 RepID=A0A6M4M912_9ALTE|nr:hypothetical protein [Alteromonas pelagimontana]QJR79617.1 hypothetical protein CA267_001800 [Alteromonas pelagimontana]